MELTPKLPALQALLARGRALPTPLGECEACCGALGIARQQDWPTAPLRALADGLQAQEGYWLSLDPVFLDVGMQGLFLRRVDADPGDDLRALAASLKPLLKEWGVEAFEGTGGTLHCRSPNAPALTTTPLDQVEGRQPTRYLPQGPDAGHWTRILHELQMVLHDHPLNAARRRAGLAPVNSYWLWGGGRWASTTPAPQVWGNRPLLRQLTQGLGVPVTPLPDQAGPLLRSPAPVGVCLLDWPQQAHGPEFWREVDQQWSPRWFRPLLQGLRFGRLGQLQLTLIDAHGTDSIACQLGRWDAWRWRG